MSTVVECRASNLRDQLKRATYPPKNEHPSLKQIIPIDEIERLLVKEEIIKLLNCQCESHQARASADLLYNSKVESYANKILGISTDRPAFPAIKILALLIRVGQSPFIVDLIEHGIYDPNYKELYTENIEQLIEGISPEIAHKISRWKWSLNPPVLENDGLHENFDKKTIMPFDQPKKVIGAGSSGKVYELEIHPSYQKLVKYQTGGPRPKFARKKLISHTDRTEFQIEAENLQLIKGLENKHLIKILKTYRHGDQLNFLFPLADGNLHAYFASPAPEEDLVEWPYWTHWLWDQLAGVADALATMSSFQEKTEETQHAYSKWFGYHLDLKPSNILIMGKGAERTLVITDFGQAYFKLVSVGVNDATRSGISQSPCGVVYAAPDGRTDSRGQINRSFDVWSFGCILLEAAVYIAQGSEELRRFREERNTATTADSKGNTACFYELRQASNRVTGFELKDAVLARIQSLKKEHQFVEDIMELVTDAFKEQGDRPTARAVADSLQMLLGSRTNNTNVQPALEELGTARKLQDGDERLGGDYLNMRLFYTFSNICNPSDTSNHSDTSNPSDMRNKCAWFECGTELQKNDKRRLFKIYTYNQRVLSQIIVDQRQLLLDPIYALGRHRNQLGFKGFALRYRFNKMKDLIHFQSTITNQDILINLAVKNVTLEEKKQTLWGKDKSTAYPHIDKTCKLNIQLWIPKSLVSQPVMTRTSTSGSSRTGRIRIGTVKSQPPRGTPVPLDAYARIIIYLDVGFLTIRVNDEIDLVSRGSALEIKPSDGIHFPAYLFDGPVDDLPGIPVSEALLGEQEDQTKEPKKLTRIRFSGFPDYNDPSEVSNSFIEKFNAALDDLHAHEAHNARRVKTRVNH